MKWLVFLLAFVGGCVSMPFSETSKIAMELKFDNEQMHDEVMKYLSVGMPIENAKRIMQSRGFEMPQCATFQSSRIAVNAFDDGPIFLLITSKQKISSRDEICVFLDQEAGLLKNVRVECRSLSP